MLTELRHFLRYEEWANRRAIESIRTVPAAHARALRPLGHLLSAELAWIERVMGDDSRVEYWPTLSIEGCEALLDTVLAAWETFLTGASEDAGRTIVSYRNSRGVRFQTPIREILVHLLTHGSHHRGQVLLLVRDEGGSPITTDYIVFVREVESLP